MYTSGVEFGLYYNTTITRQNCLYCTRVSRSYYGMPVGYMYSRPALSPLSALHPQQGIISNHNPYKTTIIYMFRMRRLLISRYDRDCVCSHPPHQPVRLRPRKPARHNKHPLRSIPGDRGVVVIDLLRGLLCELA